MVDEEDEPGLLSTKQAGKILGYSARGIRDLLNDGKLNGRRLPGGKWVISREEVERRLGEKFESYPGENFGPSLERHQQDLLVMLQRLHDAVHIPALEFEAQPINFGLEPAAGTAQERIVPLGYITPGGGFTAADPMAAVYGRAHGLADVVVIVLGGKPTRVRFRWEEDPVWDAAQQHLIGDPLLESVERWREALVAEFRARGELNTEVEARAEEVFGAPVTETSPLGEARLTLALVWLVRQELTHRALGQGKSDLLDRVKQQGGALSDPNTGTYLTSGLSGDAGLVEMLRRLIGDLEEGSKAGAAADTHMQLESTTLKVRKATMEHLLRHRLPGRCKWCPG